MARERDGSGVGHQGTPGAGGEHAAHAPSLGALFLLFLKIGSTAFGGFMALISVVQQYVVERKELLRQEEMLDSISLATILPGPVAVNVVAAVGFRLRGIPGAVVSAGAVILPAFLLLLGLSYSYFRFGQLPSVSRSFLGFVPAVAAIIFVAAWNMGRTAVRGVREAVIAVAAAGLLLGIGGFWVTVGVVAASGCAGMLLFPDLRNGPAAGRPGPSGPAREAEVRSTRFNAAAAAVLPAAPLLGLPGAMLGKLAVTFGGMSLVLFGGGYVFIPLIQRVVVDQYAWVTQQEFIDAIALGQVTPGPILISAAFIGFKTAGLAGATVATASIFTPPALLMLLCMGFLGRIKRSGRIQAALHGIRPAVVGLIAAAGVTVLRTAPLTGVSAAIFAAALLALLRYRVETAWIIPAAGVAGLLAY